MSDGSDSDSDSGGYGDLYYYPVPLSSSPPAPEPGTPWPPPPPSPGAAPPPADDDLIDKLRHDFMLQALMPSRPRERQPSLAEIVAAENAEKRAAQQRELEERARRTTADAFAGLKHYMLKTLTARLAAEAKRVELVKRLQDEAMAARLASEVRRATGALAGRERRRPGAPRACAHHPTYTPSLSYSTRLTRSGGSA